MNKCATATMRKDSLGVSLFTLYSGYVDFVAINSLHDKNIFMM